MNFPKLVALDTESVLVSTCIQSDFKRSSDLPSSGTLWDGRLDEDSWGKGHGASDLIEDNIEHVGCSLLRDKTSALALNLWKFRN